MKKVNYLFIGLLTTMFCSCSLTTVDGDEEGVYVKKPWFFGKGGVREKALTEGSEWKVFTTSFYRYKVSPQQYNEVFDDAITNNNTPVDLQAYLTLQIETGKSPLLHEKFGLHWYEMNIQAKFREIVRSQMSKYDMFTLTSNREVYEEINKEVQSFVETLIAERQMPIKVIAVIIGRAKPNQMGLEEMDRTAAQIQAKETQAKRKEAEDARYEAEVSRATADKAYRSNLGLTSEEFIQLRQLEISKEYVEILRNKPNINVDLILNGGVNPIWDIKQK
jgi:regulator of protease activity HflC (stomatin/prohibitin superfamily)